MLFVVCGDVLPLYKDFVGIFYSPSRLGSIACLEIHKMITSIGEKFLNIFLRVKIIRRWRWFEKKKKMASNQLLKIFILKMKELFLFFSFFFLPKSFVIDRGKLREKNYKALNYRDFFFFLKEVYGWRKISRRTGQYILLKRPTLFKI